MISKIRGFDNQRVPDQGDGTFLNPLFAGDHPDPTILRDGDDYFLTFSTFEVYPGLIIWHSRDLINWKPIGPALHRPLGSVFAVDLVKVDNRFYIYIPVAPTAEGEYVGNLVDTFVIWTDDIFSGEWSEPIQLHIPGPIDPGHAIGEDGRRYLFMSAAKRVRLSLDGLSTDGEMEVAYTPWRYPDDWIVEGFSLEGPKFLKRGEFFYLVSAIGGTAGPATGHMVTVSRSHSINGPWEHHPGNPIVRTWDKGEAWWSRGHATIFEGPNSQWWIIYHGYENGFRSLGRQTLLEPIEWDANGWPHALGGDLSQPIAKPIPNSTGEHGVPYSDNFSEPRFGAPWAFYKPGKNETARTKFGDRLTLAAKGDNLVSSSPLCCITGDRSYEVEVDFELIGGARGGLVLFFDRRLFVGMEVGGSKMLTHRVGEVSHYVEPAPISSVYSMKIINTDHIVELYYKTPDTEWTRHGLRFDTSGYDANTASELASLRPALFAIGTGEVQYRNFRYTAK